MVRYWPVPPRCLTERLNDYLRRTGISREELAAEAGISLDVVSRVAEGKKLRNDLPGIALDYHLHRVGFGDPRRTYFASGPGCKVAKPEMPQRWWPSGTDDYAKELDQLISRQRTRKGNPKPVRKRGRPKAPATGAPSGNRSAQ